MAFTTLSLGLTLTIPTNGTRNWGTTMFNTTWTKISQHNHTGGGDGNQMVTSSYADGSITSIKLAAGIANKQNPTTLTPSGAVQAVDWDDGNIQIIDFSGTSGAVAINLSNPIQAVTYKLILIQGATPSTFAFAASVLFPQGQTIIPSTTVGAIDIVTMYYDGTSYYADWELDYQ